MTEDRRNKIIRYIVYKLVDKVNIGDIFINCLDYVLDHIDEFSDPSIVDNFLVSKEDEEKQAKIISLEEQLAILKQ